MRSHSSILSSWRLLLAATACVSFSAHGFVADRPHHWPVAAVVQPRHRQSKNFRVFASTIMTDVPSNTNNINKVATPTAAVDAKLGNKRLAAGMAFLTAWADIVLNVRLQTFCTMMTGNLLWMIKAAAEFRLLDGVYYGLVMASYFAGLATYRSWQLSSAKETTDNAKQLRFLPTVAASVALLFVVADTLLGHASGKFWQKWIPACLLSFGFSMINGVGSDTAGTMTFVVTGHMTKLANTMVDEYTTTAGKGMWNRFCKQPSVWMSSAVFGGFMGGALFANLLRLNGWTKFSGMGEFAWIGILMSGLFVWKDSILQRSSGRGWSLMKNPLASWSKASKSETAEPVAAAKATESESTESSASTSNQQEETVDTKTLIDGTWYSDQELLDSTLATDLILSNPAIITIAPLNGTDWVSTTTTAELLLAGDNAINATDSMSSSSSSESTAA